MVAIRSTSGAVSAVAWRWCTFCSSAAVFSVPSMSWLSLLAGPSSPSPTVTPSRSSRGTGATPEARIMLDTGLCATATPWRRSSAKSVSSSQTQCAATTWASSSPVRAAYSTDPMPRAIRDWVTSSRTSCRCTCSRGWSPSSLTVASISSSEEAGTVASPTRNRVRRDAAAAPASASCSASTCSSGRGLLSSCAPYETSPRRPSRSSASTTPGTAGSGPGAWQNMSAAVVTPDSAISAPLSRVPTSASSRVRYGSIGPLTWTNHSHSVCVSPMPLTRPSEKWPWQETKPGQRMPPPSPTTSASGKSRRRSAHGPTAVIRSPRTATAPSRTCPAGPEVSTCRARTSQPGPSPGRGAPAPAPPD
jgi:hypothetical protein